MLLTVTSPDKPKTSAVNPRSFKKVSAAFGYASYDPDKDFNAEAVFKRADKAMYLDKKKMKAVRTE